MGVTGKRFDSLRTAPKRRLFSAGGLALSCSLGVVAQVIEPILSPVQPIFDWPVLYGPGEGRIWILPDAYLVNGSVVLFGGNVLLGGYALTAMGAVAPVAPGGNLLTPGAGDALGLARRAQTHENAGDFSRALEDYTRLSDFMPRSATLPLRRGQLNFRMGRVDEAIEDFDEAARADAKLAPFLWQRGVALHVAGRFEEAAGQFAAQLAVQPDNAEVAVWRFCAVARSRGVAAARAELLQPAGRRPPRPPLGEILEFINGAATAEQVLVAARVEEATAAGRDERLFLAHFYVGLVFEALGDLAKADEHLQAALAETTAGQFLRDVARVKLKLRPAPSAQ